MHAWLMEYADARTAPDARRHGTIICMPASKSHFIIHVTHVGCDNQQRQHWQEFSLLQVGHRCVILHTHARVRVLTSRATYVRTCMHVCASICTPLSFGLTGYIGQSACVHPCSLLIQGKQVAKRLYERNYCWNIRYSRTLHSTCLLE